MSVKERLHSDKRSLSSLTNMAESALVVCAVNLQYAYRNKPPDSVMSKVQNY